MVEKLHEFRIRHEPLKVTGQDGIHDIRVIQYLLNLRVVLEGE
jgi:hypothetical protein